MPFKSQLNYYQKMQMSQIKYLNDAASQIEEVIEQLSEKVKAYQIFPQHLLHLVIVNLLQLTLAPQSFQR